MATPRIGLLGPYAELPGEYVDAVADAGGVAWQVVTESLDSHDVDDLLALADLSVLVAGARRLARWRPDAVMWACTSGSFVVGRERALAQVSELERVTGVNAGSTSLAFVDALVALGHDRVAVLSPYPRAASEAFVAFLDEFGVRVTDLTVLGHPGARSSETLRLADVRADVDRLTGRGDPVLLPDTAVWGLELLAGLDGSDAVVLVANQVTLWQAFRLAGVATEIPALGVLRGR